MNKNSRNSKRKEISVYSNNVSKFYDYIEDNENNDENIEEIPFKVARTALGKLVKSDHVLLSLEDEKNRKVEIIGSPKESHVIPKNSEKVLEAEFYVIDDENERAWYITNEGSMHLCPKIVVVPYKKGNINHFYVFEDGFVHYRYKRTPNDIDEENIDKPTNPINITELKLVNRPVPYEFYGKTDSGYYVYIRYRSGNMNLKLDEEDPSGLDSEVLFKAFIGKSFPGLNLDEEEILSIIDSVDYINIDEDYGDFDMKELEEDLRKYL
jgi:hypothetical protein